MFARQVAFFGAFDFEDFCFLHTFVFLVFVGWWKSEFCFFVFLFEPDALETIHVITRCCLWILSCADLAAQVVRRIVWVLEVDDGFRHLEDAFGDAFQEFQIVLQVGDGFLTICFQEFSEVRSVTVLGSHA